jgi:hypothetical protein
MCGRSRTLCAFFLGSDSRLSNSFTTFNTQNRAPCSSTFRTRTCLCLDCGHGQLDSQHGAFFLAIFFFSFSNDLFHIFRCVFVVRRLSAQCLTGVCRSSYIEDLLPFRSCLGLFFFLFFFLFVVFRFLLLSGHRRI